MKKNQKSQRNQENQSQKLRCVECGGKNLRSKGICWVCLDCGRWFVKMPRPKKINPLKIKCIHCGSLYVIRNGPGKFKCNDCLKYFTYNRLLQINSLYSTFIKI